MPGPGASKAQAREEAAKAEMLSLKQSLEMELEPHQKKSADAADQLTQLRKRRAELEAELATVVSEMEKQEARLTEAQDKMDSVGRRFMGLLREKERQHRGLALQTHQQEAPVRVSQASKKLAATLTERVQAEATGRHSSLIESYPTARQSFLESAACALAADAATLRSLGGALAPSKARAAGLRQKVEQYRSLNLGSVVETFESELEELQQQLRASDAVLRDCTVHA